MLQQKSKVSCNLWLWTRKKSNNFCVRRTLFRRAISSLCNQSGKNRI